MFMTRAVAALVAVGALALGGCGSNNDGDSASSGSSPATPDTTAAAKPQGAAIKLGSVATCSGPLASSLGGACATIKAWADSVNAGGGLNGHPIDLTVADDAGNPAKGLAAVKKLVEQDGVVALVGAYSTVDDTWQKYIESTDVPVVGGASPFQPYLTSASFFPSGGQLPASLYGLLDQVKKGGKSKMGVMFCAEAPVCAQATPILKAMAGAVVPDTELVYSGKIAATQPNFTAACLAAKSKGAEALWINQASAILGRVAEQCAQQGYKPLILGSGGTFSADIAKLDVMSGAVSSSPNIAVSDTSSDATKAFHAAMSKYAPDVGQDSTQWNVTLTQVWSGGLLMEAAAKAGDLGPDSKPADVKKGLYALKDETLGGFAPTLNFTEGKPAQVGCYFVQGIDDGKLSEPQGTEALCIPRAAGAKLAQILAG